MPTAEWPQGCRGGREPVGALVERMAGMAGDFTSCTGRRSSSAAIASMVGWCLTGRQALVRQPLRRHRGSQLVTQSIAS